jgi:alkane 1-monooxygenase
MPAAKSPHGRLDAIDSNKHYPRLENMVMDYLRYYLNCLLPLAAIAGFLLGDHWVWLGIATLPLLLIADALSPQDYAPRNINNGALADVVIYVQMLLVLATFAAFGWRAHVGFDPALGAVQPWIASAAALIWVGLGANVGAAHELMHRHNPLAAFIGKLGFGIIGAPNRDISHTVTHHLYFDTERDFDTARRGESVYRFVPRCIWGNTRDEFDYERRRLAAQGLGLWHWKSQIVQGLALTAGVLAVMYWAGGVPALLVQLAAMIGGRILGEALNYLQHFGLLRVPGRPIEDRHTWRRSRASWAWRSPTTSSTTRIRTGRTTRSSRARKARRCATSCCGASRPSSRRSGTA